MGLGLTFKDVPAGGAGSFLKPEDVANAAALLIEVHDFKRQVPGGNYGPKDTAYVDLTVFKDEASLDKGEPTEVLKRVRIQQTVLAADLEDMVGAATVVTIVKAEFKKGGSGWVYRQVSQDAKAKVVAYAEKREAALQEAAAAAPSFDD